MLSRFLNCLTVLVATLVISACSELPAIDPNEANIPADYTYTIGAGDKLNVFVWGNKELGATVEVRPDGKITAPLVNDINASGKTPFELARDIEKILSTYIRDPVVSIVVSNFVGPYDKQIRIIGQIGQDDQQGGGGGGELRMRENQAVSVPYKASMTMLDLMVEIGGLSTFAAGNRTRIIRMVDGAPHQVRVRLADLIEDADISANVPLLPGDIVFIPESYF